MLLALLAPAAGACDLARVAAVVDSLTAAAHATETAVAGLGEACPRPLGLSQGARDWSAVDPEQRRLTDLEIVTGTLPQWMALCPAGPRALAEMAALPPDSQRQHLWDTCELERLSFLTEDAWTSAEGPVVLALEGGWVLREAGVPEDDLRRMVSALAGAP